MASLPSTPPPKKHPACLPSLSRAEPSPPLAGLPDSYALFSAVVEETGAAAEAAQSAVPGQVLGQRDGAILVSEWTL